MRTEPIEETPAVYVCRGCARKYSLNATRSSHFTECEICGQELLADAFLVSEEDALLAVAAAIRNLTMSVDRALEFLGEGEVVLVYHSPGPGNYWYGFGIGADGGLIRRRGYYVPGANHSAGSWVLPHREGLFVLAEYFVATDGDGGLTSDRSAFFYERQ